MTTATSARQDCLALPYTATTEAKARMFAAAIEAVIFHSVETEVFEDGGKWAVAVVKGMEHIGDPDKNESILAAFSLLLRFDLADGTGEIETIGESLEEFAVNQKALTKRARRAFRIEEKLDRILARLDGGKAPAAAGKSITVILNDGTPATSLTEKNCRDAVHAGA